MFSEYRNKLISVVSSMDDKAVERLVNILKLAHAEHRQVFLIGNGGSAGNAIHIENDFVYGVAKTLGGGLLIRSLTSNQAVLTCLANDVGYEQIFREQIALFAAKGDVLIALSGSGNSPNILRGIEMARSLGCTTIGILGYDGGKAKSIVDLAIHADVDDMQVAEDMQLIVMHYCMQRLCGLIGGD